MTSQIPSILVIENHPDLRAEIVAALTRAQYECVGVSSGAAAVLSLRQHEYRYILLDVDGPTAANAFFDSLEEQDREKVILIVDNENPDDMPTTAAHCQHLLKPFDTKQLLSRVKR